MSKTMDWKDPVVANLHNEMNKGSFADGAVPSQHNIFKILENSFKVILENDDVSPLKCLDIGCGAGWQAVYLDRVGIGDRIEYIGMDISPSMCELGRKNYPDGTFIVGDIKTFTHEKVPIVMSCGVIEGFPNWKEFMDFKLNLTSDWLLVHKAFFSLEPTKTITRDTYTKNHVEFRVTINSREFREYCYNKKLELVHREVWDSCTSVLLRRKNG